MQVMTDQGGKVIDVRNYFYSKINFPGMEFLNSINSEIDLWLLEDLQ